MNINYSDSNKHKNLFNDIFDIEIIFNKFKIEDNSNGEYISIQNIKYAIFFLTMKKIKKKEIVKLLYKIRKEIKKNQFLNRNRNKETAKIEENTIYSYNLIEKTEFLSLIQYIIFDKINNSKISDYDIILEFYYNLACEEYYNKYNFRKLNNNEMNLEKEIIENDMKITYDVFRIKILELFPNIEPNLIKNCFDRLDINNLGFIKISALENFFIFK